MGLHGGEQGTGASNVDIPIKEGLLDGLANGFEAGEMNDGIERTIVGGSI